MMKKRRERLLKIGGTVIILLIAFRLALPYIVLRYVNHVLANMENYTGHVDDIDIHLLRGAYSIDEMVIEKKEGKSKLPFFKALRTDLSIEWKQIFNGALVGEVKMDKPVLNFIAESQTGEKNDWREPVKKLFPLKINKFEIHDAEIHYRDYSATPDLNLYLNNVSGVATNLTNSEKLSKTLVAKISAEGTAMRSGKFSLHLDLDPFAKEPTFNLDTKVEKLNATELNDFFKAYGKFDVQEGTVGLYIEAAASKGRIKGYVKPLIENLNVLKPKEEKPGPLKFLYEATIEGLGELFKNHPKDQVATKIEFDGNIKNPKTHVWSIITNIFKNAFVHAFLPGIENSINLGDAGKADDHKKEKKEDKKDKKEKEKKEKQESGK